MTFPLLIIHTNLTQMRKNLRTQNVLIRHAINLQELRATTHEFTGFVPKHPVAIGDLARIKNATGTLLKFTEEFKGRLILLASQDNLSPVLLSRVAQIRKIPNPAGNITDNPGLIRETLTDSDAKPWDVVEEITKTAPSMIRPWMTLRHARLPKKERIIELLLSG